MKLPTCEYEGCECNGTMQLNGLRFTCDNHCTLEEHIDDYPIEERLRLILGELKHGRRGEAINQLELLLEFFK